MWLVSACLHVMFCFFFFFKQKTAYEMRISDWSSDVCSSDLTIDFYLSPTRSAKAAKRFLGKAPRGLKHWEKPATLNTDKAPSYGAAITELKREGKLDRETAHRQVKYLNNVIEADHGTLKILLKPVPGFNSIPQAYDPNQGIECTRTLPQRH